MTIELALVVVVVLMAGVILAMVLNRGGRAQQDTGRLSERLDTIHQRLGAVTDQASGYQETLNAVHQSLGGLRESAQQILNVGRDVKGLQDVLAAPKLRGGLGEHLLEDMLRQVLPSGIYEFQHTFREGRRVDAIIRLTDGVVPIDAKFPLESYRRMLENEDQDQRPRRQFRNDIKRHIDSIAQNYIIPGETLDFALMYVPSESVYYEILLRDEAQEDILDYAWEKRVIPTSPCSFYAYLQLIALGLRGLQIEQNARSMLDSLTRLNDDFERFADDYRLVGTHLNRAQAKYNEGFPKLQSLQRALPGQLNTSMATQGADLSEPSDSEVADVDWEYNPTRPRRGRPRQRAVDSPAGDAVSRDQ